MQHRYLTISMKVCFPRSFGQCVPSIGVIMGLPSNVHRSRSSLQGATGHEMIGEIAEGVNGLEYMKPLFSGAIELRESRAHIYPALSTSTVVRGVVMLSVQSLLPCPRRDPPARIDFPGAPLAVERSHGVPPTQLSLFSSLLYADGVRTRAFPSQRS